jgi:hypothetical protein
MQQPANGGAGNGKVSKEEGSGARKQHGGAVVHDATTNQQWIENQQR